MNLSLYLKKIASNKEKLSLLALFIIALLPRILLLSKGPFHWDSLAMIICGEKTLRGEICLAQDIGAYGSILTNSLFIFVGSYLGLSSEQAVLFFVSFFSAVSILIFYLFIKEFFKTEKLALYSTVLFAFLPTYFSVSTFGRTDHVFFYISFFCSLIF